jgi:hypothetical protein
MKMYGEDSRELYRFGRYSMVECIVSDNPVHRLHYLIKKDDSILIHTYHHDIAYDFLVYKSKQDEENYL